MFAFIYIEERLGERNILSFITKLVCHQGVCVCIRRVCVCIIRVCVCVCVSFCVMRVYVCLSLGCVCVCVCVFVCDEGVCVFVMRVSFVQRIHFCLDCCVSIYISLLSMMFEILEPCRVLRLGTSSKSI